MCCGGTRRPAQVQNLASLCDFDKPLKKKKPVCMSEQGHKVPEEGFGPPGTGVTGCFELPCGS